MKKSSCPSLPRCLTPSSPSCAANVLTFLPEGAVTQWNYLHAVCAKGDGDSSHRGAQGMCTWKVLALAGRDAVNFWHRPVAALSTRTLILSSTARRRGSARRGQPLPNARSRGRPSSIRPFHESEGTDCFTVYRKERRWCGVQRFSRIGATRGF